METAVKMHGASLAYIKPDLKIFLLYNRRRSQNSALLRNVRKYECEKVEDADLIVVLSGEGQLLDAIHEYHSLGIPYLGINGRGESLLTNQCANLSNFKLPIQLLTRDLPLLEYIAEGYEGETKRGTALQYIIVKNKFSWQDVELRLSIDSTVMAPYLRGDGLAISTACGSQLKPYNMGATPLSPFSDSLVIVGNNITFPRKLEAKVSMESEICVENIHEDYRRGFLIADGNDMFDVWGIRVRYSGQRVRILFYPEDDLYPKMVKLQFPDAEHNIRKGGKK